MGDGRKRPPDLLPQGYLICRQLVLVEQGRTTLVVDIEALLDQSAEFQTALDEALSRYGFQVPLNGRQILTASAATLSVEHGTALRACFGLGFPQSASSLLRLQLEALVRCAWLLHVAKNEAIDPLAAGFTSDSNTAARRWPMMQKMLQALATQCPPGLYEPLQQLHGLTGNALNSFIHAGAHPLVRSTEGFPPQLVIQLIQCSNALMHMAYRMLGGLTWIIEAHDEITALRKGHAGCLPPIA